jgi:septum formation protein
MQGRDQRIILASQSAARKALLTNAGIQFDIIPADIDEAAIITAFNAKNASAAEIALELSERKAREVSKNNPDAIVIGCDQVLVLEGEIFSKAKDEDDARNKLLKLRGKTHHLISAVSIAKAQTTLWQHDDSAALTMFDFDEDFLDNYVRVAGKALTRAVGAYEIEGAGAWLFSEVRGDYFTILGLALLPLLAYLHDYHGCCP